MRGDALRTTVCSDRRRWVYGGLSGGFVIPASSWWFQTCFAMFMFDLFDLLLFRVAWWWFRPVFVRFASWW
jgi:hypothetical protein